MALAKDEVIVLKSIDYSEADKILTLFGLNRGKFGVIAKGVRKLESKNRGNIQTGSLSKISYYEGQTLGTLREADAVIMPDIDQNGLKNLGKALFLVNKLMPDEEADPVIFGLIKQLYQGGISLREVNRFRIAVLRHLGYLPDLKICAICGEPKKLTNFNLDDFRMSCAECFVLLNEGEKLLWTNVAEIRYESSKMDQSIDNYVRGVIEGT